MEGQKQDYYYLELLFHLLSIDKHENKLVNYYFRHEHITRYVQEYYLQYDYQMIFTIKDFKCNYCACITPLLLSAPS